MTASFPTSLKSFAQQTDNVDDADAVDINALYDEVEAIEAHLGAGDGIGGGQLELGKASGDPWIRFDIGGVDKWTLGVDDSDNDKFKIAYGSGIGDPSVFELSSVGCELNGEFLAISLGATGSPIAAKSSAGKYIFLVYEDASSNGELYIYDAGQTIKITLSTASGGSTFKTPITVGVDDTGHDVKFFGATSGAYLLWDESADALLLAGDARIDLSSCTVAAGNTDGGIIKAGTSGARVTEDTPDMKFVSLHFDNGATSGDSRGIYNRLYLTGAGGGGESLRSFTTVEDVAAGTAHGGHISLNFGASGSITGLGVASRNTLHVPDGALSGGTYAAAQAEIYSDGASSDISGATEYSFLRFCNDGDATGIANVDDNAFLFGLLGGSVGVGNVMAAKTAAAVSHTLRIKGPDGNTYYLMVSDAQ